MTAFELPPIVLRIRAAAPAGARLYLVGGVVRDMLLRRRIRDLDFVLAGDGRPIARAVANRLGGAYYPLDETRGVGRVVLVEDGSRLTLDFAQQRGADLAADLAARDFTLNAMAVDLADPETIIDPLGGQSDLRAKVVRACGPMALVDDPVRAIRAVRFAAHLGYRLDPATRQSARDAGQHLGQVAAERRRDEFVRCLAGPRAAAAVRALAALDLLAHLAPPAARLPGEAWDHTLATIQRLEDVLSVLHPIHDVDAASDLTLGLVSVRLGRHRAALAGHLDTVISDERPARWLVAFAALFHDLPVAPAERQATARQVAQDLRLSQEEGRRAAAILAGAAAFEALVVVEASDSPLTRRALFRYFQEAGTAGIEGVLLASASYLAQFTGPAPTEAWNQRLDAASALMRAYFETPEEAVRPIPLVTGDDVMNEFGVPAGPRLGRLLRALYEAQAAGEVTDRAAAMAFLRRALDQG